MDKKRVNDFIFELKSFITKSDGSIDLEKAEKVLKGLSENLKRETEKMKGGKR